MNLPKGWKEIKLSDIASHRIIKNKDSKYTETYTNSAMQGIVRQTEYFDKEISNKENIADYYLVEENDYVYNPRISAAAPCGPISKSHFKETGIMSPLYTVFRITSKNFTDDYLEQYFKSHFWYSYMKSVANYGARYDRMNITTEDFFNIPVPFPPLPEQEKIARILSAQDKVIALKQKLLQEKQQQKKYLMQKLLSADGASFIIDGVEIDKSGWKKCFISEICKLKSGNPITAKEFDANGVYPVYGGNGLRGFTNTFTHEGKHCLIGRQGVLCGNVKFVEGRFFASEHAIVVTSTENDELFLFYFFDHMRLNKKSESSAQPGLSVEKLLKLKSFLPTFPEQQVIAKVLSAADEEIELLQKSIEQEKQKKKALMQLLLTGIVRVKIYEC